MNDNNLNKNKKSKSSNVLVFILVHISLLAISSYFVLTIINSTNLVEQLTNILSTSMFYLFGLVFIIYSFSKIKKGKEYGIIVIGSILLTIYSVFNLGILTESFSLPTQEYIGDFTNKNLTEVVKWASSKNITLNQVYETSDLVSEYNIISQDVKEGTLVKDIKEITVVVSEGPNYDKTVILPSFIGKTVDDVIKYADDNFLTGINIDFEESDEERDNILTQDVSGEMRRNATVNMTASIGSLAEIGEMSMEDLTGKDLFHAVTWLKRYGFKYTLQYEYSDTVNKDNVIKQDIEKSANVNPLETTVVLTISKGPRIAVPNLLTMTTDEITEWIVNNNLKVSFEENYDENIKLGDVISTSVKENDEIEQGTLVTIIISKGQLKMESFKSIADFRAWAEKYEILYNENYEFSDSVTSGNIISTSVKEGETIKNNETIKVVVSQGKSVTIPSFIGKSKSEITKTCSSIGLKCSFNYGGYSTSVDKDYATAQSKKNGSTVSSGTSVVITLSSGKPTNYNVVIQSSWLSPGNPDTTIATLKSKLQAACPGVTFNFTKKTVNTGVGLITQDSPVKGGSNTFTQGKTYTIYIGTA